jgi:hypothetical protein
MLKSRARRARTDRRLLPTVATQQHEPDHRRDSEHEQCPAAMVQFDNGRGVDGSGRLLGAVYLDHRPGSRKSSQSLVVWPAPKFGARAEVLLATPPCG